MEPTHPRKGWPHLPELRPLHFLNSNVGSLTSHKDDQNCSSYREQFI